MSEMYLFVILVITLIFLTPFFLKIQRFGFNVYTFFSVAVLVQVFLRSILMHYDLPNYDYVHSVLLLNRPWEDFILSALIFMVGSILTVSSYIFAYRASSRRPSSLRVIANDPSYKSVKVCSSVLLMISIFCFIYYFLVTYQAGGLVSAYRSVSNELEGYTAHGGLIEGVRVSFIAALLSIAYYWISKQKLFLFLFLCSSVVYLSFAFYISTRAAILIFIIGVFTMASFYNKLTKFKIFIGCNILVSIGVIMTFLRLNLSDGPAVGQIGSNFADMLGYIVVNNGGIDIPKFHHLTEYVQSQTDYRLGGFLSNIVLLFIPRTIWPEKPVNIDTEFGFAVYDSVSYGSGAVPPGIYGEFFWDFWWGGFIVAAIFVGIVLGFLDRFLHNNLNSVFVKVSYAISFLWTGMGLMGSGLVSYFISFAVIVIPLYILFYISSFSYKLR